MVSKALDSSKKTPIVYFFIFKRSCNVFNPNNNCIAGGMVFPRFKLVFVEEACSSSKRK